MESDPVQGALHSKREHRRRVLKGAHAAFNQQFSAVPCTVRDIHSEGAKLFFDEAWSIPDRFMLFVELDAYKIECERIWNRGHFCGVRFVSEKVPTYKNRTQIVVTDRPSIAREPVSVKAEAKDNKAVNIEPDESPPFSKLAFGKRR